MKKILLFVFIVTSMLAKAQPYNNEWIDYNKTYYKFKIGTTGLYRITQSTLSSLGIGSAAAQNFQLWRNGQQIPLYTSIASGALGASDYIEFWGVMNDGKPDKALYRDPDYQLNDKWSLETDTSFYFLTVNPAGGNLRYATTANNLSGPLPSPDAYYMHTLGKYYKSKLNTGYANLVGTSLVYSSAYDIGEGWTSADIPYGGNITEANANLKVYNGSDAPDATLKVNMAGNFINPRSVLVTVNGSNIIQTNMDYYSYLRAQGTVPASLLATTNNATIAIYNQCASTDDRMVVAQYELQYPRIFDFNAQKNFEFEVVQNSNGNYIEISNFNFGSTAPVLYDITNNRRYVADISTPGLLKIKLLPGTGNAKLILVSEDASNIAFMTSFQQRNFINYGAAANQGNYLIISNPFLYDYNGTNPVDDYRAYRSTPAGGGYNAKIYNVNELMDQFAFGIKKHPIAIKNFIKNAIDNNSIANKPKLVFIIGKGVQYVSNRNVEFFPAAQNDLEHLNLIPTFGFPASDNLFTAYNGNNIPAVPVGRLSAVSANEVAVYLQKVKDYEIAQAFQSPLIADKAWMKNVVHVVGADNGALQQILNGLMTKYRDIIRDTLFGANVSTFSKTSTDAVEQLSSEQLKALFEQGISLITYFGHSSASTLEFNLDDPEAYNNPGKYPVFMALGCNAGNLYNYSINRFLVKESISEKFVFAENRGAIAFIATTSLGIVQYLDIFNTGNYHAITNDKYGATIGEVMDEAIRQAFNVTTQGDFYARLHCEQISLNGDPAIKINNHAKPDYVIEDQLVKVNPSFISVAEANFKVDAKMLNMGRAINKKIVVEITRTYPNNVTEVVKRDTIPGIRYIDSISVTLPIVPDRDKGLNRINIKVDAENAVDELWENNNTLTRDVFIYEDEARPIYPYNYSIVNKQNIKFAASTANPFATVKDYRLEIDTTEFFNSPLKIGVNKTSVGGLLEFTPTITFLDSTTYYWRVAQIPPTGQPKWNVSSFVYLPNYDFGSNQSHVFQHFKSTGNRIHLDSATRLWDYDSIHNNLFIRNAIFPTAATDQSEFTVSVNDVAYIGGGCSYNSIIINAFDARTFKAMFNVYNGTNGLYNSLQSSCANRKQNNFEYSIASTTDRNYALNFLKNIVPDGAFVVIRGNVHPDPAQNTYPSTWIAPDEAANGAGNTLYHYLKSQGFTTIDSFNTARTWIFVFKKNGQSVFPSKSEFTIGNFDKINMSVDCETPDSIGYISSPVFGPAKAWKQLHWRGFSIDNNTSGDFPTVDVIGVNNAGAETVLFSGLDASAQDFDISSINAANYPYAKLRMKNTDTVFYTPYQIKYWRLTYVPVPEGAVAPNLGVYISDTVDVGEPINFKVAFKNVGDAPFDSLKVKVIITDRNNQPIIVPQSRFRKLPIGDTILVQTNIDTRRLPGANTLYVNVNPDFDQPEQYLFNNFVFKNFYVRPDTLHPVMDVTFDGIHILNKDVVASKPSIIIKLKDEAKWMTMNDTTAATLKIRYPDGTLKRFYFSNSDTVKFTPAGVAPVTDNTASIELLPYFTQDGTYDLIVSGKDMSDNLAGNLEYKVSFRVFNKAMISNMLNYPNPFTTSTAFVFTITGAEVPQNIKIEIMTVTGKIVREITKDELGPLHVGRNITDFKWDGTDQYGQKLANGIYLYRVVTNLNGKSLDKFKDKGDNTDQYFNNGYGKMYLMR